MTLDAFSPTYVIVVYYVNYVYKMFDYIFCSEVACESMCLCANIRTCVRVSMHVRVYVSACSFFFSRDTSTGLHNEIFYLVHKNALFLQTAN